MTKSEEILKKFPVYLVTFTEEIPNEKLHFLCSGNCCTETGVIKDSQTPPVDQQISNVLTIIENFCSSLEAIKTIKTIYENDIMKYKTIYENRRPYDWTR